MIQPSTAFDVQTTLARITRLRVDTRALNDMEVLYTIGFVWDFVCDEEDLDKLHDAIGQDSVFREAFDKLKPTCLRYNSLRSNR